MLIYAFSYILKSKRLWFAYFFPVYKRCLFDQISNCRIMVHPVLQVPQKVGAKGAVVAVSQKTIDPHPVFLRFEQSRLFEYFKVLVGIWLGDPQGRLKLANAHHLLLEQFHNFYPVGIR